MDGQNPDTAFFTRSSSQAAALVAIGNARAAWKEAREEEKEATRAILHGSADAEQLRERAARASSRASAYAEETLAGLKRLARRDARAARDLADTLWDLLAESEARGESDAAARFEALLREHDDGRYVDLVEGIATLEVFSDPCGARVSLRRIGEQASRDLGATPVGPLDIEPGRYELALEAPGRVSAVRELRVDRAADVQVVVRLFTPNEIGPDAFYLPAGRFEMGLLHGVMLPELVFVDNLAVDRRLVSKAQFLCFLDGLTEKNPGQALRFTPRGARLRRDDPSPLRGVSYEAAEAFARWVAQRTGRPYRLLTAAEWEKASRSPASQGELSTAEWVSAEGGLVRGSSAPETSPGIRLACDLLAGGGERVAELHIPELAEERSAA